VLLKDAALVAVENSREISNKIRRMLFLSKVH
jgi:hypothetical protein